MGSSAGGAFLPNDPPPSTGQTLVSPVITGSPTIASGATITSPTITTPTLTWTAVQVTATGATGSAAASLGSVYPAVVCATGASGAGVNLPTGAAVAGAVYIIKNMMTGALNVYSVGATINGTTGTTAYPITATGNLTAVAFCVNAGAWQVGLNT